MSYTRVLLFMCLNEECSLKLVNEMVKAYLHEILTKKTNTNLRVL